MHRLRVTLEVEVCVEQDEDLDAEDLRREARWIAEQVTREFGWPVRALGAVLAPELRSPDLAEQLYRRFGRAHDAGWLQVERGICPKCRGSLREESAGGVLRRICDACSMLYAAPAPLKSGAPVAECTDTRGGKADPDANPG